MTKKGVQQKPSETALFAALRRAIACREYGNSPFGPDHLAEVFLPAHFRFFIKFNKTRRFVNNKLDGLLPGLSAYMIARTLYFDALFADALDQQVPQIVLLGAGYDTRAYRFADRNRASSIFELDIASTQNRKIKCLKNARSDVPGQVKLAPIDFNTESLKDALEKAGYDKQKAALFIWEGVCYYLDEKSVDATLDFVTSHSHDESRLAFDYMIPTTAENMTDYYGVEKFMQTMQQHHAGEGLQFSKNEAEMEAFLKERNLKIIDHLSNEEIEKKLLLNAEGASIGKITGHFRFAVASKQL